MKIAIGATGVGTLPVLAHTAYQALQGRVGAKKQVTANQLKVSASPSARRRRVQRGGQTIDDITVASSGCRKAQAIIATLFGELSGDPTCYKKTLAAIVAVDGWVPIKQEMD
jgi:hypothetical protein